MIYSKAKLDEYASPLSDTEKEQCQNAIDMVKEALVNYGYVIKTQRNNYSEEGYAYYYELRDTSYSTITILLQGSYANNTNIPDANIATIKSIIINFCIFGFIKSPFKYINFLNFLKRAL